MRESKPSEAVLFGDTFSKMEVLWLFTTQHMLVLGVNVLLSDWTNKLKNKSLYYAKLIIECKIMLTIKRQYFFHKCVIELICWLSLLKVSFKFQQYRLKSYTQAAVAKYKNLFILLEGGLRLCPRRCYYMCFFYNIVVSP